MVRPHFMGSIVVSHPTGNRNVRSVLASFYHHSLLSGFHSTVALSVSVRWPQLLPDRFRAEFNRRRYDLPAALIHSHPSGELIRLLASRFGISSLVKHEVGRYCVDSVYHRLDVIVARSLGPTIRATYAYEDGALATFNRAKELGMVRVYDLPIAYWETGRRLMMEESARLPQWAATLGGGVADSSAKLARKTRELELADMVVTPSQFVSDSLPDWARSSKRVVVSPFGSPEPLGEKLSAISFELKARRATKGAPLRVLFAGSMGQRKGLGDLFEAMRLLKRSDVELVVMGSLQAPMEFYRSEFPDFTYEPGRPHAQVLELMRSCDVFCLPSIVEGRALVMQEAMSQGLPLIITPNTGGADLVCEADQIEAKSLELRAKSVDTEVAEADSSQLTAHGSQLPAHCYGRGPTGFLVPIRSPQVIAEAIAWFADHRDETHKMGRNAQVKADSYTWAAYGDNVVAAIRDLLATKSS